MDYEIEVRVNRTSPTRGKDSVHIILGPDSSLTIPDILIVENGDKLTVKMPLVTMAGNYRPAITLQGELKKRVNAAVEEQYRKAKF